MAMSDLLYSIFWLPWRLSLMRTKSWLIGGQFGHTLCKLVPFFGDVPMIVSVQNLVLIAVDRFGAVVFPLRSPLIRSKLCPFFISATWIVAAAFISPHLFTYQLVEYSGEILCEMRWTKAFGESFRCRLHISSDYSVYIHPCDGVSPSLLYYHDQAQDTGTSRWTVREHTATEEQTKQKRPSHVYCHRISVCVSTNSLIVGYPTLARPTSMQLSCGFGLYYDVMDYMAVGYCAINPIICFVLVAITDKVLKDSWTQFDRRTGARCKNLLVTEYIKKEWLWNTRKWKLFSNNVSKE